MCLISWLSFHVLFWLCTLPTLAFGSASKCPCTGPRLGESNTHVAAQTFVMCIIMGSSAVVWIASFWCILHLASHGIPGFLCIPLISMEFTWMFLESMDSHGFHEHPWIFQSRLWSMFYIDIEKGLTPNQIFKNGLCQSAPPKLSAMTIRWYQVFGGALNSIWYFRINVRFFGQAWISFSSNYLHSIMYQHNGFLISGRLHGTHWYPSSPWIAMESMAMHWNAWMSMEFTDMHGNSVLIAYQ